MSRNRRLVGTTLQNVRARLHRCAPYCAACGVPLTLAAARLDHIVPLSSGGGDQPSNLQLLCTRCHDHKTARECGRQPRVEIGPDGYPVKT